MKTEIQGEGIENVELWFIQIGTKDPSPGDVKEDLGENPTPVLKDTPEGTIWTLFASSWYEAVLLDTEDCILAHFGPFSGDALPADEIIPLWRGAALGTLSCDDPEPDPTPEAGLDIYDPRPDPMDHLVETEPDVFESDGLDIIEPFETVEVVDLVTDQVDDLPGDALEDLEADTPLDLSPDVPPDAPPDIPEDTPWIPETWCQVEAPQQPTVPGVSLPEFLCQDLNPVSPGLGEDVTNESLKELVWIAYSGSAG